ncbi:hypothetical protein K4039_21235 [Lyngbya sp. CCAP 1446/10]|uniref:hypothetical protein n=1 Tax=Lyngbya sp. CCAP 1446/10 TaxID=439293 RepID=UPI002237A3B7|nr:hypothetical protein [Lyngbya sp. CCAP 1446/10]MCW6052526.1 hypothetical protein [Lyngbya sp. CCAP 1446/10]
MVIRSIFRSPQILLTAVACMTVAPKLYYVTDHSSVVVACSFPCSQEGSSIACCGKFLAKKTLVV